MATKIRKIKITIDGIRSWNEDNFQENLKFFKLLRVEIEEYLQSLKPSKPIKIKFCLHVSGDTDDEIVFECHDEEEFESPGSIFDDDVIKTLIEKNVREEFKLPKERKVRFQEGGLLRFKKYKPILEEIIPTSDGQANHVAKN
jgi:hypothetical protein